MSRNQGPDRRIVKRRQDPVIGAPVPRQIVRRQGGGVTMPVAKRRSVFARLVPRPSRKLIVGLSTLFTLAVIVLAGAWVVRSPMFRINTIEVAGAHLVPPESVAERAALYDKSMFTADLGAVQRSVYELPLVSSVKMERRWPNTIRITIKERQGWGTWEQGGVPYTIDRDGVVLGLIPIAPGAPVIRSSQPGSRQQGDRVDYQAVEAAAEIYERLPGVLDTSVDEVAYEAGKGLVVTTANGQTAFFGDSSSISYKLAVWSAMAKEANDRRITYTTIDLRYGNRPVLQ